MMKDQNIVCLAYTTWEGNFVKSVVELLSRLAGNNRILFIEHQFTILDVYRAFRKKKYLKVQKILGFRKRIEIHQTNSGDIVYLLTLPPTLPYAFLKDPHWMKLVLRLNTFLILPTIKKAIKQLNMNSDIILLNSFNPFFGLTIHKKLGEKSHIYYCFDALNERRFGKTGLVIEDEFMKQINGTIVSSDYLKVLKSKSNLNCIVVKNGVNYQPFREYYDNHQKYRQKKIGYIGSIDFRFEAEMIVEVASELPEFEFEFVGRVANERIKSILTKIPNATFNSPVKPEQVPSIMFNCDAGIIPYTRTDENKNIYPLKINEYLAVGTPVVMTDFAHLPEFAGLVSVAKDKESFVKCLIEEIETDTIEKQIKRVEFASKNSWDGRAKEFENAIKKLSAV